MKQDLCLFQTCQEDHVQTILPPVAIGQEQTLREVSERQGPGLILFLSI